MSSKKEETILKIKTIQDSIRKKHKALKNLTAKTQMEIETNLKPLIDPLKVLAMKKEDDKTIKKEIKEESEPIPKIVETPKKSVMSGTEQFINPFMDLGPSTSFVKDEHESEGSMESDDDEEYVNVESGGEEIPAKKQPRSIEVRPDLDIPSEERDTTYGPYYNSKTDTWRMGGKEFISDNDIYKVGNISYPATEGLRELLFKKKPQKVYNSEDLKTYKLLLESTNSHRGKKTAIKSNKGYKYKQIIGPLFKDQNESSKSPKVERKDTVAGTGMLKKSIYKKYFVQPNKPSQTNYKYWDDPNELVDRLRLLIASKQAGNTGHDNEIISILEELKEAGIIKGFDNIQL